MPRQITSFEFKLIGFLTLKQFIYLAVFIPVGFIVYKLVPIPIINILMAVIVAGGGVAFAFVPINDRPMDVWVKNFIKRITSPTQYTYHKKNPPIYFLKNLFFVSDPHRVMAHIESEEKLAAYMAKSQPAKAAPPPKKQAIASLLRKPKEALVGQKKTNAVNSGAKTQAASAPQNKTPNQTQTQSQAGQVAPPLTRKPFFTGVVKNHKLIPLPGILIYVKDGKGTAIRLLKSNPHGVFATFSPLPAGEYLFEFKDPKNTYFFDTMKIRIEDANAKPLEFFSKELL